MFSVVVLAHRFLNVKTFKIPTNIGADATYVFMVLNYNDQELVGTNKNTDVTDYQESKGFSQTPM